MSKRKFISSALALMAIIISLPLTLNGCVFKSSSTIENTLEEKYNCSFSVLKSSSTDCYLTPDFNSSVVFKAQIQDGEVTDNLISRVVGSSVTDDIKSKLQAVGITGESSALLIGQDDSSECDVNITVDEYFEKYKVTSIFYYLALDSTTLDDNSASNVIAVCQDVSDTYNVEVAVNGVTITDKYSDCAEDICQTPDVNATWFDSYNPDSSFSFVVKNGSCNISAIELQNTFG